ncbi:MAG: prolipoprotein diacylglyceryl transferase, partial [Candidatus Acidiferrales bacterium]
LGIPTYGLMVACAMLAAFYVLRADLRRRGIDTDAETLIALPCLVGLLGAKLYHLLESPREFFADPVHQFLSQFGFAWFGGLIAGFATYLLLAKWRGIPVFALLDAGSPAAALGYGIGRIGCLLSGDGDYGEATSLPWGMSFPNGLVPTTERVHPTPIYEFIAACAIAWILWRMWKPGADIARAAESDETRKSGAPNAGTVFAVFLVLTGAARFLVEYIRINPPWIFGLTNAQAASLVSIVAGAAIWWRKRTPASQASQ